MSTFDYTGYKLSEKKVLKENEVTHAPAQKLLQYKLGADWKLVIDWPSRAPARRPNARAKSERQWVPNRVYQNYVPAIATEIAKWDADMVEAVNDAITNKKIIITMDTETVDNRYSGGQVDRGPHAGQDLLRVSAAYTITAAIEKTL